MHYTYDLVATERLYIYREFALYNEVPELTEAFSSNRLSRSRSSN